MVKKDSCLASIFPNLLKVVCDWKYSLTLRLFHAHSFVAAAAAKSLQSCPTLCDPIDGSPPGSPVPGILQARTLEWVAISFSNVWNWRVKVKLLSRVRLLATPWTAAYQALLCMGFARQEYWSGVPVPSPLLLLSAVYCTRLLADTVTGLQHCASPLVYCWSFSHCSLH